jgi:hypothetical protein
MIVSAKLAIAIFSLILSTFVVFPVVPVLADIPNVEGIVPWTDGEGNTILNITIRHDATAPSISHYINSIDVEIDGVPTTVPLSDNQTTERFVARYNMGQVTGTPTVRARAHCTVHGNGSFSAPVQVPEFSVIWLLAIFALVSTVSLLLSRKSFFQKSLKTS